ncbi:hypothetical protein CAPTEDRAFT_202784 [Capitella teleta]|uniref:Amine oxidase n=1 Tax=Capitella teleta TaxID=283909 RepID=R7V0H3_CAPTE|nr:hypothetical protein CAPTEDRAFT_202784 [Capitella teleta]|eukprot:ELU09171.1 hypothetical protein CAPTEDRAFT_202784 [Capitella teleta]
MTVTSVIVVGAGLSGLCAADLLSKEGITVTVLEANDRVGGRLHTLQDSKCGYVDVGGAYIGPTQDRMFRLMKELKVKTYDVPDIPECIYSFDGKTHRVKDFDSAKLGSSFLNFLDANNFYRKMDKLCSEVPMNAPWLAKNATRWDRMTLAEWQKEILWTKATSREADVFSRVNFAADPHEVSLLWALWYVRGAGGTQRIDYIKGGAQEKKVIGGTQQIPKKIADSLGSNVHLEEPVTHIDYSDDVVTVTTANGNTYTADHIILALAPSLQRRIIFKPNLPPHRAQLNQRVPMGSCIKTMMYYNVQYWMEKGLGGFAYVIDEDPFVAPVELALDDTKPDGSYPAIIGFVPGCKVSQLSHLTTDERKRLIADEYARVYGIEAMKHPVHYVEKNWSEEPWSGGCYVGHMGPGVMTTVGRYIREPIAQIHFAGTEAATEWPGYMEGAVESGERAAREILHAMGKIRADEVYQSEPPAEGVNVPDLGITLIRRLLPSVGGMLSLFLGGFAVAMATAVGVHRGLWY